MLGEHFKDIFIDFKYRDTDYILAPEYTFRVYEYLSRNAFPANYKKVFYSQEMARNESSTDVKDGETFSFWQIGYEIFGNDDSALSVESITTRWECLHSFPLDGFRKNRYCKRYGRNTRFQIWNFIEFFHFWNRVTRMVILL